jgi:nucleoside diphosphate kinase
MSGGPIVAVAFAKTNAIMDWRELMGRASRGVLPV